MATGRVILDGLIIEDVDGTITFNPEAKTIEAFATVIKKARKNGESYKIGNERATKHLAYIHWMEHYRSYFVERYPKDEITRDKEVRKALGLEDWKPSDYVIEARKEYREYTNDLYRRMIRASRIAAEETITYLENVDYDRRDNRGRFLYDTKTVFATIKQMREAIVDLDELEKDIKNHDIQKKKI